MSTENTSSEPVCEFWHGTGLSALLDRERRQGVCPHRPARPGQQLCVMEHGLSIPGGRDGAHSQLRSRSRFDGSKIHTASLASRRLQRSSTRRQLAVSPLAAGVAAARRRGNLGGGADVDVGCCADLVDQVSRHPRGQGVTADHDCHLLRVAARLTAAWPAELAPPAMKTCSPVKALPSDAVLRPSRLRAARGSDRV
jgi:hypothetical protein